MEPQQTPESQSQETTGPKQFSGFSRPLPDLAGKPAEDAATSRLAGSTIAEPTGTPADMPLEDLSQFRFTNKGAVQYFANHGLEVAPRTVRNYCLHGTLDCKKVKDDNRIEWRITEASLARYVRALKRHQISTAPKEEEPVAGKPAEEPVPSRRAGSETAGPAAKDDLVEFLKGQIFQKDRQIESLLERNRETNILVQSLHNLVNKMALPEGKPQREGEGAINVVRSAEPEQEENGYAG